MRRSRQVGTLSAGLVAVVGLAAAVLVPMACSDPVVAPPSRFAFALIGDAPYGTEATALFPSLVAEIDADPDVGLVAHVGDVRGGDTDCSDAVLRRSFELFQTFDDPFWFTPGDNEWTDCHRAGGFLPTERLAFVRGLFFPDPVRTTGGSPIALETQAWSAKATEQPYVENTLFHRDCVTFGAVHVVGSNDGTDLWHQFAGDAVRGLASGDQPGLRLTEIASRREAALAWIDRIFEAATASGSEAVFLMMQAEPVDDANYGAVRQKLLARSITFGKPVMIGHGDQHTYLVTPEYGGVANLTRVEVAGEEAAESEWLEVTASCGEQSPTVFGIERHTFEPVGD